MGEIGTGAGVGTAWMLSHIASTNRFVTVEADAGRATAAEYLFRDHPTEVLTTPRTMAILATRIS